MGHVTLPGCLTLVFLVFTSLRGSPEESFTGVAADSTCSKSSEISSIFRSGTWKSTDKVRSSYRSACEPLPGPRTPHTCPLADRTVWHCTLANSGGSLGLHSTISLSRICLIANMNRSLIDFCQHGSPQSLLWERDKGITNQQCETTSGLQSVVRSHSSVSSEYRLEVSNINDWRVIMFSKTIISN